MSYFLDAGTGQVLKVTPGGVQSTVPISIPGEGNGVAVDAAGDVFVSDQINNVVLEVSPSGLADDGAHHRSEYSRRLGGGCVGQSLHR